MKLTASMMLTVNGVYQGPGGPDEDVSTGRPRDLRDRWLRSSRRPASNSAAALRLLSADQVPIAGHVP
jgi:hypothetical protein